MPENDEIEVPANIPDDPVEAYIKGFKDAGMYISSAAATVANSVEIRGEWTAHDEKQDDGPPECPDCESDETQWSPTEEAYHCHDCGMLFEV